MIPILPRLSAESAAAALTGDPDGDDHLGEDVLSPLLLRVLLVGGLGSLCFGFDTGVISGALVTLGDALGHLTPLAESWIVSSALLGALVGSLLSPHLSDAYGRKPALLLSAVLFSLGALEQAAAAVYKELILGRVLVGLAVGLAATVLPTYLAELSPPALRGRIVAATVVLITAGQVLAYVVDAAFEAVPHGWRYMVGFGAVPALVQLLLAFSLPESPRHQIAHASIARARTTLRALHPHATDAAIQRLVDRIERDVDEDKRLADRAGGKEGLVRRLWRDRANRRALILACGLQFFQQATGYYSAKILQQAHFSHPLAFAILIAVSNFVCTIIALRLIDHHGRRPLLLYTLLGMIAFMFSIGLAFLFIPSSPPSPSPDPDPAFLDPGTPPSPTPVAAWFALVAMVGFCCSYALGTGCVPWVVQGEVFTHELRALGTGLSTATNWTANLVVAATFLQLSHAITPTGAFWLYALVALFSFLFTYSFLPETKGLNLEACRALFERPGDEEGQSLDGYMGVSVDPDPDLDPDPEPDVDDGVEIGGRG